MTNDEQTPLDDEQDAASEAAEDTETTEDTEGTEATEADAKSRNWLYRIAASGVGAFVLAQEEIEGRLKRLTERGNSTAESDDANDEAAPPSEPSEESEEAEAVPAKPERRPIGDYIDTTIANILHSVNMPSRGDLDELTQKIDALSEKVERLRAG
jgi:poly(hydroxyalkanoate) granule-associated protein